MDNRIKLLILGQSDTKMTCHAYHYFKTLPEELFDKRLVVLDKTRDEDGYGYIYDLTKISDVRLKKRNEYIQKIKLLLHGCLVRGIKDYKGHNFYISEYNSVSAEQILDTVNGFVPDLILMTWVRTLVSPKVVRRLYDLTHASFCFHFVDEGHLTGGCHYPVGCSNYLYGCYDCPALRWGKRIASITMKDKLQACEGLPKYVSGNTFDCQLAKKSPLFKDAKFLTSVSVSDINYKRTEKNEAQMFFGIPENSYVVMSSTGDVRKGVRYCLEALNVVAKRNKDICLLLLGDVNRKELVENMDNRIRIITPGRLSFDDMFKAYCASDCFVSTSIADSGPMMVYYSVLLGIPVVLFNIGFAQDLIVHKKNGYIARFEDSLDVAEGIEFFHNISMDIKDGIETFNSRLLDKIASEKQWYEKIYEDMQNNRSV